MLALPKEALRAELNEEYNDRGRSVDVIVQKYIRKSSKSLERLREAGQLKN